MVVSRLGNIETAKKNGRKFRQIWVIDPQSTEVLTNPKEYSRIIWDQLLDKDGKVLFKADTLFHNQDLKEGAPINLGHVTFQTSDYVIGERTVNTITVVAFSNEDPLAIANSQLNRKNDKGVPQGAYVIALDGEECPPPAWMKATQQPLLVNVAAEGISVEDLEVATK